MNGPMLGVILAVVVGLPAAIWAVFACSKDQHEYARHYSERGYSSEIDGESSAAEATVQEWDLHERDRRRQDVHGDQLMAPWPSATHQFAQWENPNASNTRTEDPKRG